MKTGNTVTYISQWLVSIHSKVTHNFVDRNTITVTCNSLTELLKTLEQNSESAVSYFKQNESIVNVDKFQAIILNKKESEAKYKLNINNNDTESTKSVKLLGKTIEDRLRFDQHLSNLCFKAVMQLNALGRLQKYTGKSEKVAIVNSFIYANFKYFNTCESIRIIEKIQKRCLRIVLDDYDSDYDVLLRKKGKVSSIWK